MASRLGIDLSLEDLTALNKARNEFKRYFINHVLARNNYNVTRTAEELDINRKTIQRLQANEQQRNMEFYSGNKAIKNSIYRILDYYLPNTEKDEKLIDEKAEALSQYFKTKRVPLQDAANEFDEYIAQLALKITGNKKDAAKKINVSERTIDRKIKKRDLEIFCRLKSYN